MAVKQSVAITMKQPVANDNISLSGGILFGDSWMTSRSYTWPLVSCVISADDITLTTWCPPRFKFFIPKDSIDQMVLKNYGVAVSLRIVHHLEQVPRYIQFGAFSVGKLKEALREFRYI